MSITLEQVEKRHIKLIRKPLYAVHVRLLLLGGGGRQRHKDRLDAVFAAVGGDVPQSLYARQLALGHLVRTGIGKRFADKIFKN